ncbi:MAG: ABC transporter permease [Christensenellaceae bacterium]|nr:ABC transporter permease [Christensenellaceae bacterium]MEA5069002.1 ABC transporter permease [Christensenellaceae bacterium]
MAEMQNPYARVESIDLHDQALARPSSSYWQDVFRRFRKDPLAVGGAIVILIITLAAIFLPPLLPYTYDGMDFAAMSAPPSLTHPCGTDPMGRDLFVRILYGARISLTIGVVAAAINFFIGVLYGGISGFVGGRLDIVLMRIVDILIGLPQLLYVVLIMLVLGSNITSVILALCFTSWIGTARVVRGEVMRLKHAEYVLAARLAGASSWDILTRHLLPNCMGPIIVSTAFLIPSAIFSEAFLSFLGIGIQAPKASWGTLANDAIAQMIASPHQMFFPVLAICLTMFSLNFIGDGLRDALDPRLKK